MVSAASPGKKAYWIIVADESCAIFYSQDTRRSPLTEIFSLENSVARQKMATQISDRGGRSFDSHGDGRHTMTRGKSGPKQQAAMGFARTISQHIGKARHEGICRDFGLIVAPRFLGVLRSALATTANATPMFAIDKEIVGRDTAFIENLLAEEIRPR